MDFRSQARGTLRYESCVESNAVLEEKTVFNATVTHFKNHRVATTSVATRDFRRVYNSRLQKLLLCPEVRRDLATNDVLPQDVTGEVDKALKTQLFADDDERTALRCFAIRKLEQLVGDDSRRIEGELAKHQGTAHAYKQQLRRLLANLQNVKTGLCEKVHHETIDDSILATGDHRKLWPELHQQAHMRPHNKTIILSEKLVNATAKHCIKVIGLQ